MSDETSTAVAEAPAPRAARQPAPDLFNEILAGGPAEHPVAQTVAEEAVRQSEEPIQVESEEDDLQGVEMTPEEIVAQAMPKETADAEPALSKKEEDADADDGGLDALLAQLNDLASQALGVQAVTAPAEPVAPAPAPVAPVAPVPVAPVAPVQPAQSDFSLDMDYDTLTDTITDPGKFKEFLSGFAQKVQADTMAQMQEAMVNVAGYVMHANRIEDRINKEYPELAAHPAFKVLIARQCQEAVGNLGTVEDDVFMNEFARRIKPVMAKKNAIVKSGQKKDVRGRFAPGSATRTSRPAPAQHKDPTREAWEQIAAVSPPGRSAELLQIIGAPY